MITVALIGIGFVVGALLVPVPVPKLDESQKGVDDDQML